MPRLTGEKRARGLACWIVALSAVIPAAPLYADTASAGDSQELLGEVIVTAQKKAERLQDVPVPVTAISADALVDSNQLRLEDYYSQIPGLSYTTDFRGGASLAIRGITTATSFANPTVGIIVDDVPYGSSTGLGGGSGAPDIDPSDLLRVEELRGPQGTLYGANSIGGLIKFVTVDPSTDKLSGSVSAGGSGVYNGIEPGYVVRGSINVPLSETLAVRASAFARRDPGYIDNVLTGQDGVNSTDAEGVRLAALWRPSEVFSLKLGALYQYSRLDGSNNVDVPPGIDELEHSEVRDTGFMDRRIQVYSATATAKLGSATLTSISAYSLSDIYDSVDSSLYYGAFAQSLFGVSGSPFVDHPKTNKVTEELRLSVPIGQHVDWLVGVYYNHEYSPYFQASLAADPNTGAVAGTLGTYDWISKFTEYAAFTDLTFHITDRFDIQLGGRESQNKQIYSEVDSGALVGGISIEPEVDTKENSFTYLATPSYKVSPDLMVYARLASGYRPGGPNQGCVLLNVPCVYGADKTSNYELGVKADLADHLIEVDGSVYYIDWKNIQLSLIAPNTFDYYANGSGAKSQGVELSVASRPLQGLKLAAWVAWNDAVLTQPFPPSTPVYGAAGDRLPYSSRFSGNVSVEQEFPLSNRMIGFVGGSVSYVGDREGTFTSPPPAVPPRQGLPGYAKTDLRAGVKYDAWTANFFVNNVANTRGLLSGGIGSGYPNVFQIIQPLTGGVTISRTF